MEEGFRVHKETGRQARGRRGESLLPTSVVLLLPFGLNGLDYSKPYKVGNRIKAK